jgi:hypothetical protein
MVRSGVGLALSVTRYKTSMTLYLALPSCNCFSLTACLMLLELGAGAYTGWTGMAWPGSDYSITTLLRFGVGVHWLDGWLVFRMGLQRRTE